MPEVYITNPLTKRAVKVGGRIYKRLLKNGDIVLKPLEPLEPEPAPESAPLEPLEPEPELEPLEPEPEESDSDDEYFNYKL